MNNHLSHLQIFTYQILVTDTDTNTKWGYNPQNVILESRYSSGVAHFFPENLGNGVILEMVAIIGGTFLMGWEKTGGTYRHQSPKHSCTVKPFFMSKYPITQAQWQAVATLTQVNQLLDPDPSMFKGADRPVEQVSWHDAVEFCARLSRLTKRDYCLPSEAEWEYACRARTTTKFHFGEAISIDLANYYGLYYPGYSGPRIGYHVQTTPVGSFQVANAFGLYDMHGNVSEWCADPWHEDYQDAPSDGQVWEANGEKNYRLLRGGSWGENDWGCTCAYRHKENSSERSSLNGFRVVCT